MLVWVRAQQRCVCEALPGGRYSEMIHGSPRVGGMPALFCDIGVGVVLARAPYSVIVTHRVVVVVVVGQSFCQIVRGFCSSTCPR